MRILTKMLTVVLAVLAASSIFYALRVDEGYCSGKLNRFSSYSELDSFLETSYAWQHAGLFASDVFQARAWGEIGSNHADGYSTTNIQVTGVDEADIVKTDGEYIYVIAKNEVLIVRAYPPEDAEVLSRISVDGTPKQIFVSEDRLAVFYENDTDNEVRCVIRVYDVSERTSPMLRREIGAGGHYFSSRMIGDYVYAVIEEGVSFVGGRAETPSVYIEGEYAPVPASEIYYSDIVDYAYAYTTIIAVNMKDDTETPSFKAVLSGCTATIYVSDENIYLAIPYQEKTILHVIRIEGGQISHTADGEVLGTVLDQFSMDEYDGYFRIVTTSEIKSPRQTNIYVLDGNMNLIGQLEGIAPGESMHSARFMGEMCYVVTFRKVDPFFVIDLSDPRNPETVGELKISGYSDYLHPYDENHLIGIGKETVAAEQGYFSWYQGIKISLYDVTDMSRPEEFAKYEIGDRGTDTPVLREHKAFLFDKERNLLALAVSVARIDESLYPDGVPPNVSGKTVWQGAFVFTISLELGKELTLRGTVTHVEDGNVYDTSHYVTRVLFIGDVFYSISQSKIKMNSLQDLSEINELSLDSKEG
jgi:inhibitor of cysteine peptidase